ncbi:MAG: nucleotide exchange factor GrpE [Planctomycetes bacterium]|nr:nucleotide exchange factor GrpE [Planctomycetota bacterium]
MTEESKPGQEGQAAGAAAPETVTLPREEVESLRQKADEYLKMAQRVQADFSNYQKRVARDREESARYLVERLLGDLLPALDTFDFALRQPVPAAAEGLVKGIQLAEREIFRKLEGHGLRRIPASGPFSPAVHEALMRVETDKVAEGEIVAELRAGYMLYERVLRPAQVSVAAKPASSAVDSPKD